VGGFAKWPTLQEMEALRQRLDDSLGDAEALGYLFKELFSGFPLFERETEYIALSGSDDYSLYEGNIASTDGGTWQVSQYKEISNEYMVPQSTAKFARHNRDSYMVGALARLNLNYERLGPRAKHVAELFDLSPVNCNPFMNNIAQIVEVVHSIEDSCRLIDDLLKHWVEEEEPEIAVKAGRGEAAVEVPRGVLFHEYEYNQEGECIWANYVIPTNQNHANIQKDMETLVPQIKDRSKKEIEHSVEMLIRAYDPCISCSTHCIFL
jgi:coenzyme F420-reducing hydrogenase alpha subunit